MLNRRWCRRRSAATDVQDANPTGTEPGLPSVPSDDDDFPKVCAICQELEDDASSVVITDCGHDFHAECLDKWKQACSSGHKPFACPMCRSAACRSQDVKPLTTIVKVDAQTSVQQLEVSFEIPFHRADIWRECFRGRPLGVQDCSVEYSTDAGATADVLDCLAEGRHLEGNVVKRVRQAGGGINVSRLATVAHQESVEWELLEQANMMKLVGPPGSNARTRIQMSDVTFASSSTIVGTAITLSYSFSQIQSPDTSSLPWFQVFHVGVVPTSTFEASFENCPMRWDQDMVQRGYARITAMRRADGSIR